MNKEKTIQAKKTSTKAAIFSGLLLFIILCIPLHHTQPNK